MPKASELYKANPILKVLIYGNNGTGKTAWGALTPQPVILLTEKAGLATIDHYAPDAEVFECYTYKAFAEAIDSLNKTVQRRKGDTHATARIKASNGREYDVEFNTVVVDSLSQVHNMMIDHYTEGGTKDTNQHIWGKVKRDTRRFLNIIRAVPTNALVICLAQDNTDDKQVRRVTPDLMGKSKHEIGQFFNAVGYIRKASKAFGVISWRLNNRYITKTPPGKWPDHSPITPEPGVVSFGSLLSYNIGEIPYPLREHDGADKIPTPKEDDDDE